MLLLLTFAPFPVILILGLVTIVRCQQADIRAVMEAVAAAFRAITRLGRG
jgi:hypothetical protein